VKLCQQKAQCGPRRPVRSSSDGDVSFARLSLRLTLHERLEIRRFKPRGGKVMMNGYLRLPPNLEAVRLQTILKIFFFVASEGNAWAWPQGEVETSHGTDSIDAQRHVRTPDALLLQQMPLGAEVECSDDPQKMIG
jgi:hypothetical protein